MVFLRNLGVCHNVVGLAQATLAADVKAPTAVRLQRWAEARESYQKALEIFSDLQKRNALRPTDNNRIFDLTGKVNECEAAMRQLRAQ